jgi:hypothetical protein
VSAADLAVPIRNALIGSSAITSRLTPYQGSFPIFTRRPMPTNPLPAYPVIMISPDISITDQDAINDRRPIQQRDIAVYGLNDTSANYRTVESLGYLVRELFHGLHNSISVPGWTVINIIGHGPSPAPTDDDQTVGRLVSLTVQLAKRTF